MPTRQIVQARVDGKIKEEAAIVLAAMGLTISDAVRMMLTRVAFDKALPFEPFIPTKEMIQRIRDSRDARD